MKAEAVAQARGLKGAAAMALVAVVVLASSALLASDPLKFITAAVLLAVFVTLVLRYPEVLFALLLTAGLYKTPPRFGLNISFIDVTVLSAISTIVGILWGLMRGRIKWTTPPLKMAVPFLAICSLSALSLLYTIAPEYGASKLSRFVTLTTLSFFAPLFLFQEKERFRNFVIAYVAVVLITVADIFHKGGLNPGSLEVIGYNYLMEGAGVAASFLMTLLYLFMTDRSRLTKVLYIAIICPVTIYTLMVTGARGPFVSLVLTLLFAFVFLARRGTEGARLRLWLVLALIVGSVYIGYNYKDFARMTSRMSEFSGGGGASTMERIYMAKASMQAITTMPYFLTGLGVGGFSVYYKGLDDEKGEYPHNFFLELGTDIGIMGMVAGFLLVFWSFRRLSQAMKELSGRDYFMAVSAGAVMLFGLLNALKSGDLNDHRLFFAMAGLIFSLAPKRGVG